MLSKILAKPQIAAIYRRTSMAPQVVRRFASNDVSLLTKESLGEPNKFEPVEAGKIHYPTMADVSERQKEVRRGYDAAEADYLETLNNVDARQ